MFPELKLQGFKIPSLLLEGPRFVRLANDLMVGVKENSAPLGIKLRTARGPVEVFSVVKGNNNPMILERFALGMLGICPGAELDQVARGQHGRSSRPYEWHAS